MGCCVATSVMSLPSYTTDKLVCSHEDLPRGRGFWKFNTSLLHDDIYVKEIKNIIKQCEKDYSTMIDKGLAWELTKFEIRSHTLPYCIKKKKKREEHKKKLEQDLIDIQEALDSNFTQNNQELYQSSKKELEQIENEEMKSTIFRSRVRWAEDGEKSSKYFLTLEQRNYTNKHITALEINGKIEKDQKKISEAQKTYYQTLYSEKLDFYDQSYQDNLNTFLKDNQMPKLSVDNKMFCDKPISQQEILESLKHLSNGKSPGSDGLPADWYKFFWNDIKNLLTNSILYAFEQCELSVEQKRGIITLIPKKNNNRLFLKNWRPISLLNTDYKIIAKVLATRLQEVLPSIVNNDQSGYLKGRYIGQNIRILEDVSFFTKHNNLPGVLLSIDFEKAFDCLNWKFLYKTLEYLNFGSTFIKYVQTMYTNIESTVLNNGNSGTFFKLQRGVRQGCPLSAYLFITALETLACKIRSDKNIRGIKIGNKEIKISLLADDITLLLADVQSVKHSIDVLKCYAKCAGLKINVEKTQAKYIGTLSSSDYYPHGLSWIKTPIETLGIAISDSENLNYINNFQKRILTLKTTLNIWKQRHLSLKGKVCVLNNLALAPLIYVSSVVDTPDRVIQEVNNIIQNFMWDGSTSKISQRTLIQSINNGGLKLCHFETKVNALKLSWIRRFYGDVDSTWTILPKYFYNCGNLQLLFSANNSLPKKAIIPTFYKDIHSIFMNSFMKEPKSVIDILNQSLWYNKYINLNFDKNFIKHCSDKNINYVKDIINQQCEFLTHEDFISKYNITTSFMHTMQLLQSVPKTWRQKLTSCSQKPTNIPSGSSINISDKIVSFEKTTCKIFYWHLIRETNHRPNALNKWCNVYPRFRNAQKNIWMRIFSTPFITVRQTKLQTFQYKILHRVIACNKWLNDIRIKDSNLCSYCTEIDDISHFFLKCSKVHTFWSYLLKWLERIFNMAIPVFEEFIIFGFADLDPSHRNIVDVINFCILHAKYYIYVQRIFNDNKLDVYNCQVLIKSALDIELYICKKNGELHRFTKFESLYESLHP
jgi:hypothetical protein